MGSFEADRHRCSPSRITLDRRGRSYLKPPQMRIATKPQVARGGRCGLSHAGDGAACGPSEGVLKIPVAISKAPSTKMSFADFTGSWVIEFQRARPLNHAKELISGILKHALSPPRIRMTRALYPQSS